MIFHLALNAFLVFLTLTILVEAFLYLFRIKNARFRAICRFLPIAKLPVDLLVFGIYGDSLFVNLNPFSCEIALSDFISNVFGIDLKGQIITQYIASHIPPLILSTIIISISSIAALLTSRTVYQIIKSRMFIRKAKESSSLCDREVMNHQLKTSLENQKALIFVSPEVNIPCAVDRRYILLPEHLVKLFSQSEFEAVIAHELEHLHWRDPISKLISSITCSLFWWIPTRWWIRRLEVDQEQASDLGIHKYGIDKEDLASAFVKTTQQARWTKMKMAALCLFTTQNNSSVKRLDNILNSEHTSRRNLIRFTLAGVLCLLTFFSFWIC